MKQLRDARGRFIPMPRQVEPPLPDGVKRSWEILAWAITLAFIAGVLYQMTY